MNKENKCHIPTYKFSSRHIPSSHKLGTIYEQYVNVFTNFFPQHFFRLSSSLLYETLEKYTVS